MLITVSGPPGGGKTTIAGELAEYLEYEHVSGGDIFRSLAEKRGLTLEEFNELAEENPDIDRDLDRQIRTMAQERDETILESRLSGWMAGKYADIRIWLSAPLDVRATRIAKRESKSLSVARDETKKREKSETSRYAEYYDIDYDDLSIYDVAINTARWNESTTTDALITLIENYSSEDDEGSAPIEGVRYEF
ncbi:MAG: (d)CMP kinase [Halobacteriaceae archaeon]